MIQLKVRRIGNSYGVVLPKEVLSKLGVGENDLLFLTRTAQGVALTPYDPNLADAIRVFEEGRRRYRNALRELAK
jgi:putative addiction module antidote